MAAAAVVKAFPSDRRERFRGRWQPEGLTEEVVLLEKISQTVDTAGGPTSSDPALRPAHLTLAGSLGPTALLKGKATFGHSAISPTNQNLFFIPKNTWAGNPAHAFFYRCDYLLSAARAFAAVRPETKISTMALPPRRLPPWMPPVTSPAAYRPGMMLLLVSMT